MAARQGVALFTEVATGRSVHSLKAYSKQPSPQSVSGWHSHQPRKEPHTRRAQVQTGCCTDHTNSELTQERPTERPWLGSTRGSREGASREHARLLAGARSGPQTCQQVYAGSLPTSNSRCRVAVFFLKINTLNVLLWISENNKELEAQRTPPFIPLNSSPTPLDTDYVFTSL